MPKQGNNIRKRKDGRWEGRYKVGVLPSGQTKYRSVYGKTYSDVKLKLISEKTNNTYNTHIKKRLRFNELIEKWMASSSIRFKGATENKYWTIIDRHINPILGRLELSQITPSLINEFLNHKLNNGRIDGNGGLSHSYVNTIRIIILSAVQYGINEKLCEPLNANIYKPTINNNELTVLSEKSCEKLEKVLVMNLDCTALGMLISLHTGLRIGEVCALKWSDVDIERKILTVRQTVARVKANSNDNCKSKLILDAPKTKNSLREIPINSFLLPLLVKKKSESVSDFVISEQKTFVSPRTFEYRYHKTLERFDIEQVNYHSLRHTFATRCIERGVDCKSLSEILGHANVNITLNTYVHSSMELKRIQIEKLI